MAQEMNLLYDVNKENLISIACYTGDGELVEAVPLSAEKTGLEVTRQQWFTKAVQPDGEFSFFYTTCAESV